jgi:hypothetical protein
MAQVVSIGDDPPYVGWHQGRCMCLWGPSLPCPNRAEWRVENLRQDGHSEMCTPHKDGFEQLFPDALVNYIPIP